MRELALLLAGATFACGAMATTTMYDTFNEGDTAHLFDCCHTVAITTKYSGHVQQAALAFSPGADGFIDGIDVAASFFGGLSHRILVTLRNDAGGLPGETLQFYQANNVPNGGQCCAFLHFHGPHHGIPVQAGLTYWIEVKERGNNTAGWNLNSLGEQGAYAARAVDGSWAMTSGPLPAMRILGH